MNVRLRMYQVLLFKFGRHLCKGSIEPRVMRINWWQKHMTSKRITCDSFPWNKAGDFRTPNVMPKYGQK